MELYKKKLIAPSEQPPDGVVKKRLVAPSEQTPDSVMQYQ